MDPKKDSIYIKMKKIVEKKWKLDKFDRVESDKFVENKEELTKIGEEILYNFNKDNNIKINFFADICSAPGVYSKIVLDRFDIVTGIGISLPPEEGGVEFEIEDKRFKKLYKNILTNNYKLEIGKKLDLGMASCVSYTYDSKKASKLNIELIVKSINLLLPNLNNNGNMIVNMTMKNIYFIFNLINVLSRYFKTYKLWKSDTIWETKNTFYFFGYGYKSNHSIDKMNKLLNDNKFIGNNTEYNNINNKMKVLYNQRIDAWNKL